jgi:hypothetical protein
MEMQVKDLDYPERWDYPRGVPLHSALGHYALPTRKLSPRGQDIRDTYKLPTCILQNKKSNYVFKSLVDNTLETQIHVPSPNRAMEPDQKDRRQMEGIPTPLLPSRTP